MTVQHNLNDARNITNFLRFSKDKPSLSPSTSTREFDNVKNALYKSGLEVNEKSTKKIGKTINEVKNFLKIPRSSVKTFVYSSPEIQAECFLGSESECILRVTSGLIKLLSQEELKFVVGHELGHFLLGHSGIFNPREFWKSQAQEISADRVGLLCAGSLDIAFRTILKTTSGLGEEHLTFDIGEFVSQMKKFLEVACMKNDESTHPSMVLRSRALIWFSMSDYFLCFPNNLSRLSLEKTDSKVIADFNKERQVINKIERKNIKNEFVFWVIADFIFRQGKFSKKSQDIIKKIIGGEKLNNLKSLLSNFTSSEVEEEIKKNISLSRLNYDNIFENSSEQFRKETATDILRHL